MYIKIGANYRVKEKYTRKMIGNWKERYQIHDTQMLIEKIYARMAQTKFSILETRIFANFFFGMF